jgi:glycosyltransferase involved in cell wall biosynthesis/SAM-dependent methyltransferase
MRIAIVTTQCPFVVGGAELHALSLQRALREEGHEAEIVSMPFKWYPSAAVLDHMLAARCLDISEFNGVKIDLAICLKFPAYLMQHPHKTFWILHQHRQAYDLWDSGHTDLFDDENGQIVRDAVRAADAAELRGAQRVFANSANVAKRLRHYNNVAATPLYHPPPLAGRLTGGDFGDYFYYPSRISSAKRQDFVLRSLALANKGVRVVFSGAPDNPAYGHELMQLADKLGVADRVEWKGFVSEGEMIDLYAGARGVLFTPIDEDLGYIALEAMLAGKPLLTLSDAGEPAALVRHEIEGLVLAPEPQAFAAALDRLAGSKDQARAMGQAGLERYHALDISWPHAVAALTGATAAAFTAPAKSVTTGPIPRALKGSAVAALASATAKSITARPAPRAPKGSSSTGDRLSAIDWLETPGVGAGSSLDVIETRYAFGDHLARHRSYYETHWPRYQASLKALVSAGVKPRRILELGTSAPYVFTALLREAFPEADFTVIQESPAGLNWHHRIEDTQGGSFDVAVSGLNVETTPLPFGAGEFDLVIAMEILEHFAIDPSFVFREAQRVLSSGGAFLVTTPNLVSLQGVSRALDGASPYSFGVFVPWNGPYGRHNREYTPHEVESLGRYAGFDSALLDTADVYNHPDAPEALVDYMSERQHPLDLRGQNIFYLGRKTSGVPPTPYPMTLFTLDPAVFSGALELERTETPEDGFLVRVRNLSPLTWNAAGPHRIRLTVDRIDQNGRVTLDIQGLDLPCDLGPGEALEIPVRALKGAGVSGCWHEIGLFAEDAGPFKGAGRTKTVAVFAETLVAAPERLRDD